MASEYEKYQKKLEHNIAHTGIQQMLLKPQYKLQSKEFRDLYFDDFPDSSKEEADFFVKTMTIGEILKDDLLWFMRWIGDPDRIEPFHEHIMNFFKYGESALPPEYLDCVGEQGGFFQFNENATREVLLVPRGVGKTTIFHGGRCGHQIAKHPDYKWLMTHSDKKRVLGNLKQAKSFLLNGKLAYIFPHLFADDMSEYMKRGSRITNERLDLKQLYDGDDFDKPDFDRKEDTITLGAIGIDRTGWHFEGFFADDLVTASTSANSDQTSNVIEYLDELEGLEEYHMGWDFKGWITGTHWWEKNAYIKLRGRKDTSIFQMPARFNSRAGKVFVSKYLPDDKIDRKIISLGVWGESQMLMIPRKFSNENSSIGFDVTRHVVTDEDGSFLKDLKKRCLRVQVCDPAYSIKNKREGDKKSRFTITQFLCDEDNTYIYGGYSSFGEQLDAVSSLNMQHALQYDIDFFSQDAQGNAQGALYDRTLKYIKAQLPHVRDYKFSSSSMTSSEGKMNIAMEVLSDKFIREEIKVIITPENREFMKKVIDQLSRKDKAMDIIDTLVYCEAALDNQKVTRDTEVAIAKARHSLGKKRKKKGRGLLGRTFRGIA